MADLRPLGSEKLQGMDKINRILEISRYNETSQRVNENKADYTIQLADGDYYSIVNEKNGYIVKRGINESEFDYIEPMKNRKYHKSYSQAMKKLNLLAGELNRIHEHTENINLIGEEKKFVLKTPEASMSDMGGDTLPPAPEPAPESGEDLGLDMDLDLETPEGGEEELDLDMDLGDEVPAEDGDEDTSFKSIQKLTGKLGQKLRTLDSQEGLTSENIKYVLNSVISAVDLEKLDEEDKDDILSNFEEEIDYDDMEGDLDLGGEEEMDLDLDLGDEGEPVADEELGEGYGVEMVVDEIFSESKVDKVISKYFVISEEEKKETDNKNVMRFITEKVHKVKVKNEIKEMSETFEQELTSEFLMKENKNTKFLGKTNKNNLVFEIDGKQLKVSPNGELL
jgi:hypothetical protein